MFRVRGSWLANPYAPLVCRAGLVLVCALLASAAGFENARHYGRSAYSAPTTALLPALLLLLLAALASVPLPPSIPAVVQPGAEALAAAAMLGALSDRGVLFRPYLLAPMVVLGLSTGLRRSFFAALATALVLVAAAAAANLTPDEQLQGAISASAWAPMLIAVALLSAWARRIRGVSIPAVDPAYADAHRLLSELHTVARQLSLGLDPRTLARALLEDVRALVESQSATVLSRSPGGLFVPLIGDEPPAEAQSAIHDAWITGETVRRVRRDTTVLVVPVVMGVRVVALVVLTLPRGEHLEPAVLRGCQEAIVHAGSRLATAMLFDDVRRLATVDERMRLAREIHDGIAQDLASVGYLVDDIARDTDGETAQRLADLRAHLGSMVTDLRLSIFDLRAGVDDVVGLGTAIGEYVQRVGSQSGLVVHVMLDESPRRLPTATEVELLRILQEAVTNVRKHARATNLWLSLTVDPPRARLAIEDDGRGLQRGRADSMGITGMRERARRIGARLAVGASEHGGTRVEVLLDGVGPEAENHTSAVESVRTASAR